MISVASVYDVEGKLYPYRPSVFYLLNVVIRFFPDIFFFRERSNNRLNVWALILIGFGLVAHALVFAFTGNLFSLGVSAALLLYIFSGSLLENTVDNYVSHITSTRGLPWKGRLEIDFESWFLFVSAFISTGIGDCYNLGYEKVLFFGSKRSLYRRLGRFYYDIGLMSVYTPDHPLAKFMDEIFTDLYPCLKK